MADAVPEEGGFTAYFAYFRHCGSLSMNSRDPFYTTIGRVLASALRKKSGAPGGSLIGTRISSRGSRIAQRSRLEPPAGSPPLNLRGPSLLMFAYGRSFRRLERNSFRVLTSPKTLTFSGAPHGYRRGRGGDIREPPRAPNLRRIRRVIIRLRSRFLAPTDSAGSLRHRDERRTSRARRALILSGREGGGFEGHLEASGHGFPADRLGRASRK